MVTTQNQTVPCTYILSLLHQTYPHHRIFPKFTIVTLSVEILIETSKEKSLEAKLRFLQSQVRIGGKGSVRRKKKIVHQTTTTDDKKLQSVLKKLSVSTIPDIEEVNIFKDDLSVIHFNRSRVQASTNANMFAISGHGENRKVADMLPELLPQLSDETMVQLRRFASDISNVNALGKLAEDDDVPMLVDNFDEASKNEIEQKQANEISKSVELVNMEDNTDNIETTNETVDKTVVESEGNKQKKPANKKRQIKKNKSDVKA